MNWNGIEARWDKCKVAAQYLARRLQEAYSLTPEEAERQFAAWQVQILINKASSAK